MHSTVYRNIEELVRSLVSDTKDLDVNIITVDEHGEKPTIQVDYSMLTPRLWKMYEDSRISIVHQIDLDVIYNILCFLALEYEIKKQHGAEFNSIVIVDGFISCISILFSRFVSRETVGFDKFNFRKVYLIFMKIKELDELLGFKFQINETSEIWQIIDKIYLPCTAASDYDTLVDYLSKDIKTGGVFGSESFVNLEELLNEFGIERVMG